MAATFQLKIVTPTKKIFDGPVESLVAPGVDGYFGVLAYHAPLIAALVPGTLTTRVGYDETQRRIEGGFLEFSQNRALLLADETDDSDD